MNNEQSLKTVGEQLLKAHYLGEYRTEIAELKSEIIELKQSIDSFIKNSSTAADSAELPVNSATILQRFGISDNTLRKYRTKGLFPFSRIGLKYLYKISEVEKALNKKGGKR